MGIFWTYAPLTLCVVPRWRLLKIIILFSNTPKTSNFMINLRILANKSSQIISTIISRNKANKSLTNPYPFMHILKNHDLIKRVA